MTYLAALIHEITFLDNKKAAEYLSKFDDGMRINNEFYSDSSTASIDQDEHNQSYLASFWPQTEKDDQRA